MRKWPKYLRPWRLIPLISATFTRGGTTRPMAPSVRGLWRHAGLASAAVLSAWSAAPAKAEETSRDGHRLDAFGRPRPMMFVRDPDEFAKKWKKFSTDGIDKLVVIADFDFTLTTAFKPTGERADSSHGILMKTDALDPKVKVVGKQLFQTYYPIEQSVNLTPEEKLPFMIEWWNKEHDTLIEYKLTKQLLKDAVEASDVAFRDGFFDIVEVLADQDVPTLIFSAGLYDVIHAVLDKEFAKTPREIVPKNVHVVSNMMRFDESGTVVGFDGKLIHSLNKNASAVTDTPFWKQCQLEKRENILLLGDSMGDADMANGLDVHDDQIVRVGFLNDKVDERLEHYLRRFDVVLTHDSSLLPVELMLHQIEKLPTTRQN